MKREKSIEEMEVIRAADSLLRQKAIAEFVPEKNESKPVAHFEISRYTQGQFMGLFIVSQIFNDQDGKTLKKPIKKVIAEGVDIVVAMSSLETALRRRVFR